MGYWKLFTAISFMGFCLGAVLLGRDAQAIEETKFKVIESEGRFELRQYFAHIVAETLVEGDFSKAGNEAFNRLAGYINGQNRRKQTIPMRAACESAKGGGEMAFHISDASGVYPGNTPRTFGFKSGIEKGARTSHGCPKVFRLLEQESL